MSLTSLIAGCKTTSQTWVNWANKPAQRRSDPGGLLQCSFAASLPGHLLRGFSAKELLPVDCCRIAHTPNASPAA